MSASPTADRSMLRRLRKTGSTGFDGRGRMTSMPPILHYGFRPFFFLAALYACLAVPAWLSAYAGWIDIAGPFGGMRWHAHEMLFGYLAAVVAGFILTAIPNWTGRLPLSGVPLAILVALWLAGRLACLLSPDPWVAMGLDLAFPASLAFAIWREVVAGRNWRNAPVAAMVSLFGVANAADHLANLGWLPDDLGQKLAMATIALLIALIGGRIVPSFTRNWLVRSGSVRLPAPFGWPDRTALAATAAAMVAWLAIPGTWPAGAALVTAGVLLSLRLARWCGLATISEPIVFVLHVGYGWLCVALVLLAMSTLLPFMPISAAIHALTAGAVGTMTLAVMTRASLGHTGRPIVADRLVVGVYVAVTLGATLRVAAPFAGQWYLVLLAAGGGLWSVAFLLFAIRYTPILWGRRAGV